MSAREEAYELLFQILQPGDENLLVGETSAVEFPSNKTVASLKNAIRGEFCEILGRGEFSLWKLDPKLSDKEEDLKTIKFPCEGLEKFDLKLLLSEHWPNPPPSGHLHFLIELLPPPTLDWHRHDLLDHYQSLASFVTREAGSFKPFDIVAENKILEVNNSEDHDIVEAFRLVKVKLGRLFHNPLNPDAVTNAVATSLQNNFFVRRPPNQDRKASAAELLHYHQAATLPPNLNRFLDKKETYFNWTYMMPVARELSQRRHGSQEVSDFIANKNWSIHLYPYTPNVPATADSPAIPRKQYKYKPRSDFQILRHGIPQVLVEVQSADNSEQDRYRMLLQAGAVVRVVHHAIGRDVANLHVLIAYYINNALEAIQYLLCIDSDLETVKYSEYKFDLCKPEEAIQFLLELYNCPDVIDSNDGKIKPKAMKIKDSLGKDDFPSFIGASTSNKKRKTTHGGDGNERSDGGLLAVPHAEANLRKLGYQLESRRTKTAWSLLGDTLTPSVVAATARDGAQVMIKRAWSAREAHIHQLLAGISDAKNHTMDVREVLRYQDSSLLVLPRGTPLPSLCLNQSLALSLAQQLVDGVGFMHARGLVHLDLKPNNLVAISNVLKIIDFGLSRKVGDDTILKGYRGTQSWVAPELGTKDGPQRGFRPIPADLWAVGLIISRFFGPSLPPGHYLFNLAARLTSTDPQSRPRLDKFNWGPRKRALDSAELGRNNLGMQSEVVESESAKRRHLIRC
ncbi:hypothetical protein BT69DRAFT_1345130 [Atractiella rhizophila]|nr:hypothetical protein BT69DRAFT_1345130 [Atractiella rhizophila]